MTNTFRMAIIALACMTACDDSNEPNPNLSTEQRMLNENIALWQRSTLSSYRYTYRVQCFCPPEEDIVIVVVNNQVSQAFRTPSGTFLTAQELTRVTPIEGLFTKVQEAINRNVFSLRVTYNATFGYPANIVIDGNQQIADDEVGYTARDFQ